MKRAIAIKEELGQIVTIEGLTSVFESIASIRISKLKNKVLASKGFFAELWQTYTQLRVDPNERAAVIQRPRAASGNTRVSIVITSEGGLSGDIDERIVSKVLEAHDPAATDILVVGDHGLNLFAQRRTKVAQFFKTPEAESFVDVTPIINEILKYQHMTVYYQTYVSLAVQEVAKIDLISAVEAMSDEVQVEEGTISSRDYIFEPSIAEIVQTMEATMLALALSQVILESKLAQDASRFNAMNAAKEKAKDMVSDFKLYYNRAKRAESDGRLKEVVISMNNMGPEQ